MTHTEKINNITKQITIQTATGKPFAFVKKSVSHVVPNNNQKIKTTKINIGELTDILEINVSEKTCVVESGVTFINLVKATLPLGFIPYVVPELKNITIGGAISGCSVESMSYKYGGFHDSCLEYEIITGDGKIINCSKTKNSDIFEMIHGSYGTLGLLTKIKFKLYPAKPFVKLSYINFSSFDEFWNFFTNQCHTGNYEFIDAIIHAPDKLVACLGNMITQTPYLSSYEKENVFYKSTLKKQEDYMTTEQYLFRYDTECHWLSRAIPILEWRAVRKVFGRFFLGSDNMIRWSKRLNKISLPLAVQNLPPVLAAKKFLHYKKRPDMIVDVFIPKTKFPTFWQWYKEYFDFFPLWIVPYKMPNGIYPWINYKHTAKNDENFFIDAAIYGKKNTALEIDYSDLMENKVFKLGGIKTLISRNHYSPTRFAEIYNLKLYNSIKQKTDPTNSFGTVFERMVTKQKN
ncbi:MAG: hypothetical protein COU29_03050 [Candidatus Magasanikbacteria bacterium CG10_big_fil_rev_8_21_14_0_10_36_32]|uniref:Delta(24)-sterol reductase n=1 Tax=Candidatus Magasanikbacteria bacterium CG10_big_fil_rev_8_21_14_0_10_36_32 TaxID=1974646 RepID=A0A2M6W650_9BACT|nr:MAG: hypothetical protein COU29_03050 [Candidatus Magasanikbacteria bacterium CG10_big_fil_rev_8_21_14_0_10_36_32]